MKQLRIYFFIACVLVAGTTAYETYTWWSAVRIARVKMKKEERTITVIEGWTVRDIARDLSSKGIVSQNAFLESAGKDWSAVLPQEPSLLGHRTLEGFLFPDTYRIFFDASADDIVKKLISEFEKKTAGIFSQRYKGAKEYTPYQILILASILEREVQRNEDRSKVADIFYRRMMSGMPLQADSTVNYITGKKTPSASALDISLDSPYNTYKNHGLPPTPICNPGLSALMGALHPTPNSFWYFLTTPDGTVVYSKTFEEHVRNKKKYLK